MSNVEFPGEEYNRGTEFDVPKTPTMVKWVMKTGLVKDEEQANVVLIVLAVLFFALAVFTFADIKGREQQPTYLEDIPAEVLETLPPEILQAIPSRGE